jgi:Fms-interacting protein/Thoc5
MKAQALIFKVWSRECFITVYIDNRSKIVIVCLHKIFDAFISVKKKKKRGGAPKSADASVNGNTDASKIRQLLSVHPLSIKVDIKLPSGSVVLTFKFLPAVEVAVVDVKLKVDKDSQIFSADKEVIFNSFF